MRVFSASIKKTRLPKDSATVIALISRSQSGLKEAVCLEEIHVHNLA